MNSRPGCRVSSIAATLTRCIARKLWRPAPSLMCPSRTWKASSKPFIDYLRSESAPRRDPFEQGFCHCAEAEKKPPVIFLVLKSHNKIYEETTADVPQYPSDHDFNPISH